MTTWDSLYLPSDNQNDVAARLRESLIALGYTLYDPFGLIPGKSYEQTVRLFVSPPLDHWVRIIGRPDPRSLGALAGKMCLYLRLDGDTAVFETYAMGYPRDIQQTLKPYLRSSEEALRRALYDDLAPEDAQHDGEMTLPDLPPDIQALAQDVDPDKAQQMIDRVSKRLLGKVGGSAELSDQAQNLMSSGPRWESLGGLRIHALMQNLDIPDNWREPDFSTLRDAYQLHARRQRKRDARLYPGDEDIMAQVPNALDYIPVYGGCED